MRSFRRFLSALTLLLLVVTGQGLSKRSLPRFRPLTFFWLIPKLSTQEKRLITRLFSDFRNAGLAFSLAQRDTGSAKSFHLGQRRRMMGKFCSLRNAL